MPDRYGINVDVLTDLGLTQNQAKVYLSAAKIGPATISDVAEHSGVRREEIYRLLPDLEKIGLIERLMGKPMRVRTPDVKAAMSTLIRHERAKARERISDFVDKTMEIEEYLSKTGLDVTASSVKPDDFALLEEPESVRTRVHEMIKSAGEQIDVIYSRPDLVWFLSTQSQLILDAVSRGVKLRLLSNPTSGKDRIPKILERRFSDTSQIVLKYMTSIFANYVIVDRKSAIVVTSHANQPHAHNLYTTNENLVLLIHRIFEESWKLSSHWKTVEGISISESSLGSSEQIDVHQSILFTYNHESRKRGVISNFINQSLKRGDYVLYICSKSQIADVKEFLTEAGIAISDRERDETLRIISADDFLVEEGKFSIEKAIDKWDELYFLAHEKNKGTTSIFDMQFFFDGNMTDIILDFESELHKMLDSNMRMMCVYKKQALLEQDDPLGFYSRIVIQHDMIFSEEHG